MELTIPSNKLYPHPQQIDIPQSLLMMIGENGCGKSAILEKVFHEYLEDPEKQVICFTSGLNESYSPIFNDFIRRSKRYLIDPENQEIDAAFNSFYFHSGWSKILIFFATALKREGRVRQYFREHGYCNESNDDLNDDTSSTLCFSFRIEKWYIQTIQYAIQKEAREPEFKSIRKTVFHRLLSYLAEYYISSAFDFEMNQPQRKVRLAAKNVADILNGAKENEIFTFLSLATKKSKFMNLESCELNLNDLKINDLSDGEFQLLTVYAILDLFDSQNTIFLFDEIDSHLHYQNIQKLWENLRSIQGRIITTTHSADSIISNRPETIKLVQRGKIEENTTPVEIFKRLESLSDNETYSFKMMAKLPFIALVENKFDWLVFRSLCNKKIGTVESLILDKISVIPCPCGFDSINDQFGGSKIRWVKKLYEISPESKQNSIIFLICDKDNLPLTNISRNPNDSVSVTGAPKNQMNNELGGVKNTHKSYLLSWKRREIENYLLSSTMLANHDKLAEIQDSIPRKYHESLSNGNNAGLDGIDVKTILKTLYLKDGYEEIGIHEEGVDYEKLRNVVSEIPPAEISQDIVNMFNFLKSKMNHRQNG